MDNSEQWLLDGKCTMCRRENYCTKACKAYLNRRDLEMREAFSRALLKAMTGGYDGTNRDTE